MQTNRVATIQATWNLRPQRKMSSVSISKMDGRTNLLPHPKSKTEGICFQNQARPMLTQAFLAFSTLLFIISVECLVFTAIIVPPGLLGRSFSETQCKVSHTILNGNVSCQVDSINHHGETRLYPCLQIYVIPLTEMSEEENFNAPNGDIKRYGSYVNNHQYMSQLLRDEKSSSLNNTGDVGLQNEQKNFAKDMLNNSVPTKGFPKLLFQNEISFLFPNHLYKRCSYLPLSCPQNVDSIVSDMYKYAFQWGSLNLTYTCYYSHNNGGQIMLQRTISDVKMLWSVILPVIGFIISIMCCTGFWWHNSKRISRLFIYNSWSAS